MHAIHVAHPRFSRVVLAILTIALVGLAGRSGKSQAASMTILHSFGDGTVVNDGSNPMSALIQGADGNYYGTTMEGGVYDE